MMPDEPEANESDVNGPTKLDTRESDADEHGQPKASEAEDGEDVKHADNELEVEDFDELFPPNQLANKTFADYQSEDEIAAAAAAVAARRLNEESGTDGSPFEPDGDAADSEGSSDGEPEPVPVQVKVRIRKSTLNVMFTHLNDSKRRERLDEKLKY